MAYLIKNGCTIFSCFFACNDWNNSLRASAFKLTASLASVTKSCGLICSRLISDNTSLSAHHARNSSKISCAKLSLPGRSACRKPTCGSSPAPCSAPLMSLSKTLYTNNNSAFTPPLGGRRLRLSKVKPLTRLNLRRNDIARNRHGI